MSATCMIVGTVSYHDHDRTIIARLFYGPHQCSLAHGIKVGIGFIQHDKAGAVEKAASEANPLALTTRQR